MGWESTDPRRVQLERQAARISVNRVVAGVHFPVDAFAGEALGRCLAAFFLQKCRVTAEQPKKREFSVGNASGDSFDYPGSTPNEFEMEKPNLSAPSPLLVTLTTKANTELQEHGLVDWSKP